MADAGSTSNAPANPTSQPNDAMDQDPDPELDSAIDPAPAPADPGNPELEAPLPETREPTRKDISLREFLGKMDDYAPIVRLPPCDAIPPLYPSNYPATNHPLSSSASPQPRPTRSSC